MKDSMLPRPLSLLEFVLSLFDTVSIQGREVCLGDFIKVTFNIGFWSDIQKPVSLALSTMLDMTKLYILIAV